MGDERELARRAVESDLFGTEGLADTRTPPVPEKYVLERLLGEGGGGAVYLARDRKLNRPVALKYLTRARPAEVERFLREARFAARLNDPAIVQIYEAGEIESLPFIAMQYIDGGNLATVDLGVPDVVRVMRRVAQALEHAHREGIVHRDIKPENILVDHAGRAFVTDFGIARDLRGELGATISQDGQIMGTPALMPPEQARGDIFKVDSRSDVYALGATLYFKLAGRWPFEATNLVDMLHAVIHDQPAFPRTHNAAIPRGLEAIVVRCMKKRRDDRYASMADVVTAFDDFLQDRTGPALSAPWFQSYVREVVEEAPPEPEPAVEEERDWRAALEVAQQIAGWDAHLYRVRSNLPRQYAQLDRLIGRLDKVLQEQPDSGWARYFRGLARFRRGEPARALEDMERSIDRVRDLAGAYFELGRLYLALYLDEHREAHKHITRAGVAVDLKSALTRVQQASVAFAEAKRLEHDAPAWQTGYADAVKCLAEGDLDACVAACEAILEDEPDVEEVWKLQGDARRRLGKDPRGCFERAVEVRRSFYEALLAHADYELDRGETGAARAVLRRALEIHPDLSAAHVMLARSHLVDGALEEALAEAEPVARRDPECYEAAVTLAECLLAAQRLDDAREELARARDLPGCQNRVSLLASRALLQRARARMAAGEDVRADLKQLLELKGSEAYLAPDNQPWRDLVAEAEAAWNSLYGA